jgi:hypothetical protein
MTEDPKGKGTQSLECEGMECKAILEKLSEYIDGELDPKICKELENHMQDCHPCLLPLQIQRQRASSPGSASSPP